MWLALQSFVYIYNGNELYIKCIIYLWYGMLYDLVGIVIYSNEIRLGFNNVYRVHGRLCFNCSRLKAFLLFII